MDKQNSTDKKKQYRNSCTGIEKAKDTQANHPVERYKKKAKLANEVML